MIDLRTRVKYLKQVEHLFGRAVCIVLCVLTVYSCTARNTVKLEGIYMKKGL